MKNNTTNRMKWLSLLFAPVQAGLAAEIGVMTQNQYLGADLTPVISATTPAEFNGAVVDALKQVAANNTTARIAAQAALIAKQNPALAGLQEVYAFGCADIYHTGACDDPAIKDAFQDHLTLTLSALGGAYQAAATVINFNVPAIPFDLYGSGVPAFLSVIDRDVILRRNDVAATTPPSRSLVVMGGINSSPQDPPGAPYRQFIQSGFADTWALRPGNLPGHTCCQFEDLTNQQSTLTQRIDMIFLMESPAKIKDIRVVGDTVASKTPPPGLGRWPSDHGSVTARMLFY